MKQTHWQEIIREVEQTLQTHYPSLHIKIEYHLILVWGIFPVRLQNKVLERFEIEIVIDREYPQSVPRIWEVGCKITRDSDHHVYPDGNLCLFYPDARAWYWAYDANFLDFLSGPVNDYFLGQIYFRQEGKWPFGEMRHGVDGAYDFYTEKLGTKNIDEVLLALKYLSPEKLRNRPKGHWPCYCGSGKKMRDCHFETITELHQKIAPVVVQNSLNLLRKYRTRFTT